MEIRSVVVSMLKRIIGDPKMPSSDLLASHTPLFCDKDICSEVIPQCYTDYEPRVSHGFNELIVDDVLDYSSKWTKELSFFDAKAVAKGEARGMGYIDRKYIYISQGINTTLSFYIHPYTTSISEDMLVWKHAHPTHAHINTTGAHGKVSDVLVEETSPLRSLRGDTPNTTPNTSPNTPNTPSTVPPPRSRSTLFLCELQKGFLKYPEGMDDLISANVYISYDAAGTSTTTGAIYHNNTVALHRLTHSKSYIQHRELVPMKPFKDFCYESVGTIRSGRHIITIEQSGVKQVNLAYVLFK